MWVTTAGEGRPPDLTFHLSLTSTRQEREEMQASIRHVVIDGEFGALALAAEDEAITGPHAPPGL